MVEIESGLIYSMLRNAQAFLDASAAIKDLDIFTNCHTKELYQTLLLMSANGEPFDEPILKSKLSEPCKKFYDNNIKWCYADPEAYETYIEKILDNRKLQNLETIGGEISFAIKEGKTLVEVLTMAEDRILQLAQKTLGSEMVSLENSIAEYANKIKAGKERGITTTIAKLDEMTNGFIPGQLIIVAGRPGMGKSAFAMQVAYNNALRHQVPFGVVSLEMSNEELLERLIANVANIESWKLRTGKLSNTDWEKFNKFQTEFKKSPFYFDDIGNISIALLRAKVKRLKLKNKNLGGLVVDYLQLMESNSTKNRVEEVSEISRGLKILAKELKIPIIAVSQLSRKVEDRENKRPVLSDLRESGSIEQDADVVLMLYRDDYYKEEKGDESLTEIIISKQRNGPTGVVRTVFQKSYQRFLASV